MASKKLLGVDAGGTFTDFIYVELGKEVTLQIHKTLSTPAAPEQAIIDGIQAMGLQSPMQNGELHIVHGSTVATNAALEGKVARTVFVTNYGFADMLSLARQTRPKLYSLEFPPVPAPVPRELCLETGGRLAADGSVVEDLTAAELDTLVTNIKALEPAAVAINLLFSFLDDRFERLIVDALKTAGLNAFISRSSSVLPEYKEYERGIATWLNASLGPVVSGYLLRLQQHIGACSLQIMQSSGETIAADKAAEHAVNLLLSGPAGGLTAIHYLGQQTAVDKVISFDMGGTSTDVALLDGDISTTNEGSVAQYPVGVAMVDMHTIGAGGGSIAFIDSGGMLQVGPESAGADPGPACYGKGGDRATVTDANLVLGRLLPEAALAGNLTLDRDQARAAIKAIAGQIGLGIEETALGIVRIANEHMARAIRLISVNRGHDPGEFVLASFGGAGGLHVCAIAEAMQMDKAMVPVHGGVLSALGMVVANRGRQFSRTIGRHTSEVDETSVEEEFASIEQAGIEQLTLEGVASGRLKTRRSADMRYLGQSYTLNVPWQGRQLAIDAFNRLHQQRYGYSLPVETELVNLRAHVLAHNDGFKLPSASAATACNKFGTTRVYGHAGKVMKLNRASLKGGQEITGPAIVSEYSATTYIAPNWMARVDDLGNLLLNRVSNTTAEAD